MSRRRAVPSLDLGSAGAAFGLDGGGSRFLFAVPPEAGRVTPTVAVGAELTRRGHKVAWVGPPDAVRPLLERGATLYPAGDEEPAGGHGTHAPRPLWEDVLVPFAHATLPAVEAAIEDFRPHVVVADQQVLAAPVAARRRGIPWATSALMPPPEDGRRALEPIMDFQRACGETDPVDLRFSDHLVLVFSTPELAGGPACPGHFAFVGPVRERPSGGAFPWEWLDGARPAILVSPGTADAGERLCRVAAEAVADLDVQAVLAALPGTLPDPPPNALVRRHVPQAALLPRLSAVVCHGDHGIVCETLAHGLPLVVAPVRDDQRAVARQVTGAGAGVAASMDAAALGEAITAVLQDPSHRRAAQAVRASFEAAGGAAEAADRLEKLL
ncbi:glycosyltransferase [Thermomonospora amylolytica]|uniref:glycosyltransferase n=1 Tax=Thermomonospora amylolytica TaxID=1411117 RepID=UPI0018E4E3DA|nr:nucleotide disphospho-sugar-binding domain-containing protein [Thermomonospora amylolytica]